MSVDSIVRSQSNLEMKSLYEIISLPHQGDLQDYFLAVMAILSEYFQVKYSVLFLKGHQQDALQMEALYEKEKEICPLLYSIQQGTMVEVLNSGQPKVIKDLGQESILCVPLLVNDDPLGVITMNSLYGSRDELDEDLRYFSILSSILSPVIKNYLLKKGTPIKLNPLRTKDHPLDEILEEKLSEVLNRIDPYVEAKTPMTLFHDIIGIVERSLIKSALKRVNYVQVAAAQLLEKNQNTILKNIKELKIKLE